MKNLYQNRQMRKVVKSLFSATNWQHLEALSAWVVEEGIRIQQIAAPTFEESERANYIAEQFTALGMQRVSIDEQLNVYGYMPGKSATSTALMVVAHSDTVFPRDTDLTIRRTGNIIYGPGLGDNSVGVSGMLGLAKSLYETGTVPDCGIWFVATSCEEGLGDLKGIREAYSQLRDEIGAVINLEGLAYGHIYHAGIAVHRIKVTARTEGGHSWLHYGRPSATHAIVQIGAEITGLNLLSSPRTTLNIGMLDGGQAINSIASSAALWLDLRSESQAALEELRAGVYDIIESAERSGLSFEIGVVGDRPTGAISAQHPLVQGAMKALELQNMRGMLETGSTDGNIPLSQGCPTVTIGITRGGNAHRLDEYIDTLPVKAGMQQLITLALAAAHYISTSQFKAAGD